MKGNVRGGGTLRAGLRKGVFNVDLKRIVSVFLACGLLVGASAGPVMGKKPATTPNWGVEDSPMHP